jgi:hypothetical protein
MKLVGIDSSQRFPAVVTSQPAGLSGTPTPIEHLTGVAHATKCD